MKESGVPLVALEGLRAEAPLGRAGVAVVATVKVYGLFARINGSLERMLRTELVSPEAGLLLLVIQEGNVLKV